MKKSITWWEGFGFIVTSLLGTLLHFLYGWTQSFVAALFSSVNESTWEHMKLLFFPMFLVAVVQNRFIGKEYDGFWCIKRDGMLLGVTLIPVIFYTLRGIFGNTPDFVNIAIFFVAAAIAYLYETRRFQRGSSSCKSPKAAMLTFCLIAVLFWGFTFITPTIPLFQNPVDGSFGLPM